MRNERRTSGSVKGTRKPLGVSRGWRRVPIQLSSSPPCGHKSAAIVPPMRIRWVPRFFGPAPNVIPNQDYGLGGPQRARVGTRRDDVTPRTSDDCVLLDPGRHAQGL